MNLHRERRVLFDSSASLYDRFRPGYPDEVVRDVVELSALPADAVLLEIGSGTGKATVPFAREGFTVECIERGAELCRVLEENCRDFPRVSIRTGEFETAEIAEGRYDMVFSAQAFHWILPSLRYRKTWRCLKPGGTLALFWNYYPNPEGKVFREIEAMFRREVPDTMGKPAFPYRKTISRWRKELARQKLFGALTIRQYPWSERYSADEYASLFFTYSDFLSLPAPLQDTLSGRVREIVSSHGGYIERPYLCVLYHLRRKD